jgi:hypothetical protein
VRAALDTYGVPYTYFGDTQLREGNLRAKYDVIIFPHVGGTAQSQVNGIPKTGSAPIPYKKTAEFPSLGANDSTDDIRGGMGYDGLQELVKFVQQGGTLITEGSTSTILPEYHVTNGLTVENPPQLFARGSVMRGIIVDKASPLAYGYPGNELPVYFNQDPVLAVAAGGFGGGRGGFGAGPAIPGVGMNITPMASASEQHISSYDPEKPTETETAMAGGVAAGGRGGRGGRAGGPGGAAAPAQGRGFGGAFGGGAAAPAGEAPRVVLEFPANPDDMLLSGTLAGGQALAKRVQLVDLSLGQGHVVSFAIRPFWRWQTQGTYFLAFNAILNWNDLDTGRTSQRRRTTTDQRP